MNDKLKVLDPISGRRMFDLVIFPDKKVKIVMKDSRLFYEIDLEVVNAKAKQLLMNRATKP